MGFRKALAILLLVAVAKRPARADENRPLPNEDRGHPLASVLLLSGLYAGVTTWTYFAWYKGRRHGFRAGGDGTWRLWRDDSWFSPERYAGGADKLGHAFSTYGFARGGSLILRRFGGFRTVPAALVGTGLAELFMLGVEIKDGYAYRFSYGDFVFNTLGAGFGLALEIWPALDEALDFRVQYYPSPAYRHHLADGNVNFAEDYSGQTYLLAYHLAAVPGLDCMTWPKFIDVTLGFETRGYKPDPPYVIDAADPLRQDYGKRQTLFIGVSLNAQGVFDYLLHGRSETLRKPLHGFFEVFNPPFSNLPLVKRTNRPQGTVPDEQ